MGNMSDPDHSKAQLLKTYISQRDVLKRFLKARMENDDVAEDIVQEMFFRLERAVIVEELQNPIAYLYKMALNLAHDHRRERTRSQRRDGLWAESAQILAGADSIADTPSAEAGYDAKQRLEAILAALDELSSQCRRVFILHKFEGLSHSEIVARVGIARSTVEKHMSTALRHLVKRLGDV